MVKIKKFNWRKWCDECTLAAKGVLLATREKRFVVGFLVAFLFFGTLMNLLAGGTAKFELMGVVGLAGALRIVGEALVGVFGVQMIFLEWLPVFLMALLQGILIGLIVLLWHKKRVADAEGTSNSANMEKAGIVTGLIALGAGCPTCGTTLLTPLLGAVFSTGGLAVAGVLSNLVTLMAVFVALFSVKRLGLETYVIMVNEKYLRRKRASFGGVDNKEKVRDEENS